VDENSRKLGNYPETGFEEINWRSPGSRLLAWNNFRLARYPGLIPVGSQKLSSHYKFLATTIRITADKGNIGVHRKWRRLQVHWRDLLVTSKDVDI